MNICVSYKSSKSGKYVQFPMDENDVLDYSDYEIYYCGEEIIYNNTNLDKVNIPNIKGLVKMIELGEFSYKGIFRRLLRGETFLEIENELTH